MALAGKVALVTSGTGIVGSGIISVFLKEGATVVAPVRGEAFKLTSGLLPDTPTDKLLIPQINALAPEGPAAIAEYIKGSVPGGLVHHVVAIGGGAAHYGLLTDEVAHLEEALRLKVVSVALLAAAVKPILAEEASSSFTIVTGALGEFNTFPPLGLTVVANGAQFSLALALQSEYLEKPQRIVEARIYSIIRRDDATANPGFPGPATATSVLAQDFLKIVTGDVKNTVVKIKYE